MNLVPIFFTFLVASINCGSIPPRFNNSKQIVKQNWGYIDVRSGAHMFYWMFYTKNHESKPIVLWLQGGPGIAASGLGNFFEVGPFNTDKENNSYPWNEDFNVLFVDSPVGTGYSYVDTDILYAVSDDLVAQDLLVFLKKFDVPDFYAVPLYIFGEGYGAKIAAELALKVVKAKDDLSVDFKFKGLIMGNPWISPENSIEKYSDYLYTNSFIDAERYKPLHAAADVIQSTIKKGYFVTATNLYENFHLLISNATDGINLFYTNSKTSTVLTPSNKEQYEITDPGMLYFYKQYIDPSIWESLERHMNFDVKKQLLIPDKVIWGGQSGMVYQNLKHDYMKSSLETVEILLNKTDIEIMIYNGQFDGITPAIGTETWVSSLRWPGIEKWAKLRRLPYNMTSKSDKKVKGYYKKYQKFQFHWILETGHLATMHAGEVVRKIMCNFIKECS